MKKFLSTLLIGAFVFGVGALDIQTANAAPFNKAGYATKKPEQQNRRGGEGMRTPHYQKHRIR